MFCLAARGAGGELVSGVLGCRELQGKDGSNMLWVPVSPAARLRWSAAKAEMSLQTAWFL